jgi:hypothetical protein
VQQKRTSGEDRLGAVLVHPAHRPLYVAAKTAAPQLIWGISSMVASAILRPLGIRNLDTVSPWTHKTSCSRTATTGMHPSACCSSTRRHLLSCTRPANIQISVSTCDTKKNNRPRYVHLLAQPSPRGGVGVGEVYHLRRCDASGF